MVGQKATSPGLSFSPPRSKTAFAWPWRPTKMALMRWRSSSRRMPSMATRPVTSALMTCSMRKMITFTSAPMARMAFRARSAAPKKSGPDRS